MNASASSSDDALLEDIRHEMRTQVREIAFEAPDNLMTGGVKIRIPLGERTNTVIDLNVRELDSWARQMRIEAARQRRLRWIPFDVGGTTYVALVDRLAAGEGDEDVIEIDKSVRYGALDRARLECSLRNARRRKEMSA